MVAAGFVGFEIVAQADVFSGAPQQSSAANYGTLGIAFRARKALDEDEWREAAQPRTCEVGPMELPVPILRR